MAEKVRAEGGRVDSTPNSHGNELLRGAWTTRYLRDHPGRHILHAHCGRTKR